MSKYIAYVNKNDNTHESYMIDAQPDNVAKFIMLQGLSGDIVITDIFDNLVGRTFGTFVDRFTDYDYMQQVLKVLVPLQRSGRIPKAEEVDMKVYE